MRHIARWLWYFAFFWVAILSVATLLQYYDFKDHGAFLDLKQRAIKTGWYLPGFYLHIIGSSIILLAGFFQFIKRVYQNRPLHQLLGKLYVWGVLFFAAPGAYIMTCFIDRGPWVTASFFTQNSLWILFTITAFVHIKQGRITGHVKMMRRSYALAFAAVTLRLYIFLFSVLGSGINFDNNYIIIAFCSWMPNLLFAELLNRMDDGKPDGFATAITKTK